MHSSRSWLIRSPWVYLGALITAAGLAFGLGIGLSRHEERPPGRVLAVAEMPDEELPPSLRGRIHPPPEFASQEQWAEALPILEKAAQENPDDMTAQRQLALAYYNLGLLEKARDIYLDLLQTKEDALLRNRLGNVLRDLGDLKGAERAYRQAIVTDPELANPYVNLAELLWRQHRDSEAVAVLQQGLTMVNPESRPFLEQALESIKGQTTQPSSPTQ